MGVLNLCFVAAASAQWNNWNNWYQSSRNGWNPYGNQFGNQFNGRSRFQSRRPRTQSIYPSMYPVEATTPAAVQVLPSQPAPQAAQVAAFSWVAALAKAGFSSDGTWAGAKYSPNAGLIEEVPKTSSSSYPQVWSEPQAALKLAQNAVAAKKAAAAKAKAKAKEAAAAAAKAAAAAAARLAAAGTGSNYNNLYAKLDSPRRPAPKRPSRTNPFDQMYTQLGPRPDYNDLEDRYGKQLRADDPSGPASADDFTQINGQTFQKNKLRSMEKNGPQIYNGKFKRTPPSVINEEYGGLTGKQVVSYDFHGVLQHCRSAREACRVNDKMVANLIKDAQTYDIIIVTAGVPEGNEEMVDWLKNEAKIWQYVRQLYNSGSKWEVMVDLGVLAHYDDLMDNNRRINARATGIRLLAVNAERQTFWCWKGCNVRM